MISRDRFHNHGSPWSLDQCLYSKVSDGHSFDSTAMIFCIGREGLSIPSNTKYCGCRSKTEHVRAISIYAMIPGSAWSGFMQSGPQILASVVEGAWLHDLLQSWARTESTYYTWLFKTPKNNMNDKLKFVVCSYCFENGHYTYTVTSISLSRHQP